MTAPPPPPTRPLIDTSKISGKPSSFAGEASQWREWRFGFETWWACLDVSCDTLLEAAVVCPHVIIPATSTPDVQEMGRILYLVLAQTLKGRPLDLLKTVSKSNGFESYRILVQEYVRTEDQEQNAWHVAEHHESDVWQGPDAVHD